MTDPTETAPARPEARIKMGYIERGLAADVTQASMDAALAAYRKALFEAMAETLVMAGTAPESIGRIILVGGSSLMALVADEAVRLCPAAETSRSEAFTAVVDGLAIASGRA